MIATFLLAFQFLTVIPLKIKEINAQKIADSAVYFPLVGGLIGLILIGLNRLLIYFDFSNLALNVILVVALIVITGGMHLDGLSDTADAFLSGKSKEEMLNIMRDSHAGVMGVLSLIIAILLKSALLFSISSAVRQDVLVLMCMVSRWSVVPQMFFFPYARKEGKAAAFIEGMNKKAVFISSLIATVGVLLVWQINGLGLLIVAGVFSCVLGKFVSRKISGITGDTIGATIELTEIVVLLTFLLIKGNYIWIS